MKIEEERLALIFLTAFLKGLLYFVVAPVVFVLGTSFFGLGRIVWQMYIYAAYIVPSFLKIWVLVPLPDNSVTVALFAVGFYASVAVAFAAVVTGYEHLGRKLNIRYSRH